MPELIMPAYHLLRDANRDPSRVWRDPNGHNWWQQAGHHQATPCGKTLRVLLNAKWLELGAGDRYRPTAAGLEAMARREAARAARRKAPIGVSR